MHATISIHAPARGATAECFWIDFILIISIHAPARGATFFCTRVVPTTLFQSTLPQGERRYSVNIFFAPVNFNPRSRKGSDFGSYVYNGVSTQISIHAPARGATSSVWMAGISPLFQSTLPQGERRIKSFIIKLFNIFQSTLPQGERHDIQDFVNETVGISIHAPARGATQEQPKA